MHFLCHPEMNFQNSNNKYVYVKQNPLPTAVPSRVLINPNFNKTVFVNPNFQPASIAVNPNFHPAAIAVNPNFQPAAVSGGKIHINPNVTIRLSKDTGNIHVNPKVLGNVPTIKPVPVKQPLTYSSKTKLVRKPLKEKTVEVSKKVRRSSLYSKFKIIKSPILNKPSPARVNNLLCNKYKLRRVSTSKTDKLKNRFKLDNRRRTNSSSKSKFVFINRFLNIKDVAKKVPLRTKSIVNISGNLYKSSPNRLQKTNLMQKNKKNNFNKKNKYKIDKTSSEKKKIGTKVVSRCSGKKQVSLEKLKKCNIPCPYYRKLGRCKGNELGKCPRKHDPDQIALCTKFLQGACIDLKCLLSHNVSPEKMPTCKYYLEGSCSKDNCPYLHIRISPKADICRDFLEGFCKKAAECDKRHQFLCPDYEKKGACQKPRCSYPHGRMVRKYSVFNKYKFAKKCSTNNNENTATTSKETNIEENVEKELNRYYLEKNVENSVDSDRKVDFRLRLKLGDLPTFISLEDT